MKKLALILVVLGVAAAIGYLAMNTPRREAMLARVRKTRQEPDVDVEIDIVEIDVVEETPVEAGAPRA